MPSRGSRRQSLITNPMSPYARSLGAHIRERAARRVFTPPGVLASAICPHCGAPNANPGMEELLACAPTVRQSCEGGAASDSVRLSAPLLLLLRPCTFFPAPLSAR